MIFSPNFELICIVGAGRSGTTFLARSLTTSLGAVDIGENRYLWSYGQRDRRTDVRSASEFGTQVRRRIYSHLQHFNTCPQSTLIDHTPSNAFRINFISTILPDTKFIHIVRDGRDNVLSALKQWQRPWIGPGRNTGPTTRSRRWLQPYREFTATVIEFQRLRQAGHLPVDTWLSAGWDRARHLSQRFFGGQQARHFGARVPGLADQLRIYGLEAAVALQWRESALNAHYAGRRLSTANFLEIRFEDILTHPDAVSEKIRHFLKMSDQKKALTNIFPSARDDNREKWKNAEDAFLERIEMHLRPTVEFFGYVW